jgi:hypothetical protein
MQKQNIDYEALQQELEFFRQEKEKIRVLVGQIGGKGSSKYDKIFNIISVTAIAILFILDIVRHAAHLQVPLPPLFSLEIGILLVSLKIIWMMHKQVKVEHFQFWILNSIEFRLNDVAKRIRNLEKKLK